MKPVMAISDMEIAITFLDALGVPSEWATVDQVHESKILSVATPGSSRPGRRARDRPTSRYRWPSSPPIASAWSMKPTAALAWPTPAGEVWPPVS